MHRSTQRVLPKIKLVFEKFDLYTRLYTIYSPRHTFTRYSIIYRNKYSYCEEKVKNKNRRYKKEKVRVIWIKQTTVNTLLSPTFAWLTFLNYTKSLQFFSFISFFYSHLFFLVNYTIYFCRVRFNRYVTIPFASSHSRFSIYFFFPLIRSCINVFLFSIFIVSPFFVWFPQFRFVFLFISFFFLGFWTFVCAFPFSYLSFYNWILHYFTSFSFFFLLYPSLLSFCAIFFFCISSYFFFCVEFFFLFGSSLPSFSYSVSSIVLCPLSLHTFSYYFPFFFSSITFSYFSLCLCPLGYCYLHSLFLICRFLCLYFPSIYVLRYHRFFTSSPPLSPSSFSSSSSDHVFPPLTPLINLYSSSSPN